MVQPPRRQEHRYVARQRLTRRHQRVRDPADTHPRAARTTRRRRGKTARLDVVGRARGTDCGRSQAPRHPDRGDAGRRRRDARARRGDRHADGVHRARPLKARFVDGRDAVAETGQGYGAGGAAWKRENPGPAAPAGVFRPAPMVELRAIELHRGNMSGKPFVSRPWRNAPKVAAVRSCCCPARPFTAAPLGKGGTIDRNLRRPAGTKTLAMEVASPSRMIRAKGRPVFGQPIRGAGPVRSRQDRHDPIHPGARPHFNPGMPSWT